MSKVYAFIKATKGQNWAEEQEREIRDYCEKNNLVVDEWVKDIRDSCSGHNTDCLQSVIGKLEKGDVVIFETINRISRDGKECRAFYNAILEKGADVIAVDSLSLSALLNLPV